MQMAPPERFGIFSSLFDSTGSYLALLHLNSPFASSAVSAVVKCCQSSDNPHKEVGALLDERNWRPNLVAAAAISVLNYQHMSNCRLWAAFDSGSWVMPQLAVAAYLSDPDFLGHARVRIALRCPLDSSSLASRTPLERHIAAGPAGGRKRSAKGAASLVQLVSTLRPTPDWFAREQSSPDLIALLSEDVDRSAQIAEEWLLRLKSNLKTLL